ncbi:hypothetical protein [Geminocystis sp.]|uniref:hypothetical protein n=1 Tax=Geminocystis sp. TaxID=2664100 RepID=UPI0035942A40
MPKLTPVSWKELVTKLNELGFEGPFSGGKHPQMCRGNVTLIIPNPIKKKLVSDYCKEYYVKLIYLVKNGYINV